MKTDRFITSEEADRLFDPLNSAEPNLVFEKLRFVESADPNQNTQPLFQYDSDLNHAWYLLGLAYEKTGEMKAASKCFRTAAQVWVKDTDSFIAYSNVEDDLEKQVQFLEWGLTKNDDPKVKFNLANALIDSGNAERAMILLDQIPGDFDYAQSVEESRRTAKRVIDSRREE